MRLPGLRTIFRKEVVDALRDRRAMQTALLFPLLGPAVLALALWAVAGQARTADEQPVALPVIGAERAPNLVAFLREQGAEVRPPPADPEATVRAGDADVVLEIGEGFAEALRAGRPAPVRLVLDDSRQASRPAIGRVRAMLEAWGRRLAAQRLLARGVHPAVVSPLAVEERDLATPQSRAALVLSVLPYFLVMAIFMGGMYVAIDATAGERERQSLEPLLVHPVPRAAVVLGKTAASAVFSAVALTETALGFVLVPRLVKLGQLGFPMRLDPDVLVRVAGLMLPLLLLACALMIGVAARARSYKAAQASLSFLMLVPAMPGMLLAFMPVRLKAWMLLIPALGEQLLVQRMIRAEAVEPLQAAMVMASTLGWAALVSFLTIRAFRDERFLFR
jgi:sodium transport system permease protein